MPDGRSYLTRFVQVTHEGSSDVVLTGVYLFKKPEASIVDLQDSIDLWQKYSSALGDKKPGDFEEVPGMDIPWYLKLRRETGHNDKFPGLQTTKADMTPYNEDKNPLDRRDLYVHECKSPTLANRQIACSIDPPATYFQTRTW